MKIICTGKGQRRNQAKNKGQTRTKMDKNGANKPDTNKNITQNYKD